MSWGKCSYLGLELGKEPLGKKCIIFVMDTAMKIQRKKLHYSLEKRRIKDQKAIKIFFQQKN
jgi:hypothetical protein